MLGMVRVGMGRAAPAGGGQGLGLTSIVRPANLLWTVVCSAVELP